MISVETKDFLVKLWIILTGILSCIWQVLKVLYSWIKSACDRQETGIESLPEKSKKKLENLVNEVIETERNYVKNLQNGIELYYKKMDSTIKDDYDREFNDIEQLYQFHRDEFLPLLIATNADLFEIATLFYSFIQKDHFYKYVMYAINRSHTESFVNKHYDTFEAMRDLFGDKIGVKRWLFLPIQRLPQYKLLFGEIIKVLSANSERVKDIFRACNLAQNQILLLLDRVNQSFALNLIEPTDRFDISEYGKFRKMDEFEIYDIKTHEKFFGKLFLFEKVLLCTKSFHASDKLELKRRIELPEIMYIDAISDRSLKVKTVSKDIQLSSEVLTIQEWTKAMASNTDRRKSSIIDSGKWDEQQFLLILWKVEEYYIQNLKEFKKQYLENADDDPRIKHFMIFYDFILDYHCKNIAPPLCKPDASIIEICNLFKSCLQDPTFQTYNKYSTLLPEVTEILEEFYKEEQKQWLHDIEDCLLKPLQQLHQYKQIFNKMVKTLFNDITCQKEVMLMVAKVQVEISQFENMVRDNFKIHSKKSNLTIVRTFGMIQYSDYVKEDINDTRTYKIFIMDNGLLAVNVKSNLLDSDDETFETFKFGLPYDMISYKHSAKWNKRIKIYSKLDKSKKHSVIFRTLEKKHDFLRHLDDNLEIINNLKINGGNEL